MKCSQPGNGCYGKKFWTCIIRDEAIFLLDVAASSREASPDYRGLNFIEICDELDISFDACELACLALSPAWSDLGPGTPLQEALAEAAARLREGWKP